MGPIRIGGAELSVVTLAEQGDTKYLRVPIAPISDKPLHHPKAGELRFDRTFAEKLIANFSAYRKGVPGDYDHGVENATGNPDTAKASGWVKAIKLEASAGGEVLVAYLEPTAKALGLVEAKEYKYSSPSIHFNWPNPDTGKGQGPTLLSIALTNRPFITGMPAIEVTPAGTVTFREAAASTDRTPGNARHTDQNREPPVEMISLAEHNVKIGGLEAAKVALTERVTALEGEKVSLSEKLAAEQREKVALSEKLAGLEQAKRKADAEGAVDALVRAGKATPAERESLIKLHEKDAALFSEITSNRPVVANLGNGKGTDGGGSAGEISLSDQLSQAADAYAKDHKVDYREALEAVIAAKPELAGGLV